MVLDQLADGVATLATWLVVVLAAPLAWQADGRRGEMDLQQSVSGILLMLMVARRGLFESQVEAQQWVEDSPMRVGKYLAVLYVGNGLMMWVFNPDGEVRLRDARWDAQQLLGILKQWMSAAFDVCVLAATVLGIFVGGIVCTAYLASCLPWSRFFFGEYASSPSLSPLSLAAGAAVYSSIFLIMELFRVRCNRGRANRAPATVLWEQFESGANIIGWACVFMNTLYVAIEILL